MSTKTDFYVGRGHDAEWLDLFIVWETEEIGVAFPRRTGWPWPTSHVSSWIVAFDPAAPGVFVTVGGGVRWEPLDPRNPREPTEDIGPPDLHAWLRAPADPPSVPLPLMRDPRTGLPTAPARWPHHTARTQHDTQGEGQ
jgi:hypothetical protein